jgi:hypothetical protein
MFWTRFLSLILSFSLIQTISFSKDELPDEEEENEELAA